MSNLAVIPKKNASISALLSSIRGTSEDYEFYPSTDAQINIIRADMDSLELSSHVSLLDIGCGDGRLLKKLTNGARYGIERSETLLNNLDASIFVVGTNFYEQTIIDKQVEVVVSNPPFAEFESWCVRIIEQANASVIYLIVPERWERSERFKDALDIRNASADIIGCSNFNTADRPTRFETKVHVLRIQGKETKTRFGHVRSDLKDPFTLWFDNHFSAEINRTEQSVYEKTVSKADSIKTEVNNQIEKGANLIEVLSELYQKDMEKLMDTYLSVCKIDSTVLSEINVNMEGLKAALKQRIAGLKTLYWNELFSVYTPVTRKLTVSSRASILKSLTRHTHVDFTVDNAIAITRWIVRNADTYLDDQLISTYERMIEKTNIVKYKSNHKAWSKNDWMHGRTPTGLDKIKLDLRCIVSFGRAIVTEGYGNNCRTVLDSSPKDFISDLSTVAETIGYGLVDALAINNMEWDSGKYNEVKFIDSKTGEHKVLFSIRAYAVGTIHLKMNPNFLVAFNANFGRLKGWIKSAEEASVELSIPLEEAEESFDTVARLSNQSPLSNLLPFPS